MNNSTIQQTLKTLHDSSVTSPMTSICSMHNHASISLLPTTPERAEQLLTEAYWRVMHDRLAGRTPDSLDSQTRGRIYDVARWLTGGTNHRWLYLYGRIGCGKSTMARAIVEALALFIARRNKEISDIAWRMPPEEPERSLYKREIMRQRNILDNIPTPLIISAKELARIITSDTTDAYERLLHHLCLVIDDVGTEPVEVRVYGSVHNPFEELIESRYNAGKLTIMTSNLAINNHRNDGTSIASRYGERIADRFMEECERVVFVGESFRGRE